MRSDCSVHWTSLEALIENDYAARLVQVARTQDSRRRRP